MLGQASLEYLLVGLIALSLLGISLCALGKMRESAEHQSSILSFRSSALSLSDAMNEVCALGDGNRREIYLEKEMRIETEKTEEGILARFHNADASLVKKILCGCEESAPAGAVYVENENGEIRFTRQ